MTPDSKTDAGLLADAVLSDPSIVHLRECGFQSAAKFESTLRAAILRATPAQCDAGDAKKAMAVGIAIAEKHKEAVLQLVAMAGSAPIEKALHGNLVWLASQIMVAIQSFTPQLSNARSEPVASSQNKYEQIAKSYGWRQLRRGWCHQNAEQYWGWVGFPVFYATAQELCEKENLIDLATSPPSMEMREALAVSHDLEMVQRQLDAATAALKEIVDAIPTNQGGTQGAIRSVAIRALSPEEKK